MHRLLEWLRRPAALVAGGVLLAYVALVADIAWAWVRPAGVLLVPVFFFALLVPVVLPLWLLAWWVSWAVRKARAAESTTVRIVLLLLPWLVCIPLAGAGLLAGFIVAWLSQCIGSSYC